MAMAKPILLNAFHMNTVAHQSHGMWRHPRDHSRDYNTLGYWLDLARTLERGCFDGLFLADVLGVYDVYQGSPDAASAQRHAGPRRRPAAPHPRDGDGHRAPGLRRHRHAQLEPPYPFARRMSTLDHLDERTDRLERSHGLPEQRGPGHGSLEAGEPRPALRLSRRVHERRVSAVGGKLGGRRRARRQGDGRLRGSCEGAPRALRRRASTRSTRSTCASRRPNARRCSFQAGASGRGRAFAARHAECVFFSGTVEAGGFGTLSLDLRAARSRRAGAPTTCASSAWPRS